MEQMGLFEAMLSQLRETVTTALCHLELRVEEPQQVAAAARGPAQEMHESHVNPLTGENEVGNGDTAILTRPDTTFNKTTYNKPAELDPDNPATWGKVRRNAPCPCGTGKKYKQCHGKAV